MQKEMLKIKYLFIYMFGDNIIPDDMLDGFYDKTKTDASNNIVDVSNNIVDASNNIVDASNSQVNSIKPIQKNIICGGGDFKIQCLIRPVDKNGDMIQKFGR